MSPFIPPSDMPFRPLTLPLLSLSAVLLQQARVAAAALLPPVDILQPTQTRPRVEGQDDDQQIAKKAKQDGS